MHVWEYYCHALASKAKKLLLYCWLQYGSWITQIQLLSLGSSIWTAVVFLLVCEFLGSLNPQLQREAGPRGLLKKKSPDCSGNTAAFLALFCNYNGILGYLLHSQGGDMISLLLSKIGMYFMAPEVPDYIVPKLVKGWPSLQQLQ